MPPPASASGVSQIPAAAGPGVSLQGFFTPGYGQLRDAQTRESETKAEASSPVRAPLRSRQFQLAQSGGAMLRSPGQPSHSPRGVPQRGELARINRRVPCCLEQGSKPFVWTATVESIQEKLNRCRETPEKIQPGCASPKSQKRTLKLADLADRFPGPTGMDEIPIAGACAAHLAAVRVPAEFWRSDRGQARFRRKIKI